MDDPLQAGPGDRRRDVRGLWIWLLVAGGLRFFLLSRWSLWGDEAYSYINARDLWSPDASPSLRAYPLFFVLEWFSFAGLEDLVSLELRLRLVPALAGTLAVGALFYGSRGFLGRRERHLIAALACFSPWFVYHSQFARFYSLLLLLSTAAVWAFLGALKAGSPRRMTFAMLLFATAILTHPTAALLLLGILLAALLTRPFGTRLTGRLALPVLAVIGAGMVVILLGLETISTTIGYKLSLQDTGADSMVDLALGITYNLGLPVTAVCLLGMPLLLREDREMFWIVLFGAGAALAVVFGLAFIGSPVEQRYLIPVVPLILIPGARLLDGLMGGLERALPRTGWIVPVALLLSYFPGLVSQYVDGDRHDLRGAAELIAGRIGPDDAVVAENHFLMSLYLDDLDEERIVEAPPQYGRGFDEYRRALRESRRLWVVIPADFVELGGDREAYHQWAWKEGRLVQELYHPRYDYHQNRLEVFLVDLATAERWKPVEQPTITARPED
jgi:hypothetical protein